MSRLLGASMKPTANDPVNPDDTIRWKRAAGMAALWVTSLVVILGGASVLLDAWGSRDRTNPIPFWCHLSLGPVILMAFVSVPGLAGRMHRSSRVEKLVGIFSLVGVLLTLLCWTSPFLGILQVGP